MFVVNGTIFETHTHFIVYYYFWYNLLEFFKLLSGSNNLLAFNIAFKVVIRCFVFFKVLLVSFQHHRMLSRTHLLYTSYFLLVCIALVLGYAATAGHPTTVSVTSWIIALLDQLAFMRFALFCWTHWFEIALMSYYLIVK